MVLHYERTPYEYKIATKSPAQTLDIYTNTFIDTGFKGQQYIYGPGHDSPSLTYEREDNLKTALAPLYQLINVDTLKDIMLKPIPQGGVFCEPGNTYSIDSTLYSYVYDIKNSLLYFYVPNITPDWIKLNVSDLF